MIGTPDYTIYTDGSGTTIDKPGGWCALVIDNKNDNSELVYAGKSHSTNNVAELHGIIDALAWLEKMSDDGRRFKIKIISDSEITVKGGNKEYARSSNGYLWAALEYFEKKWDILFLHIKRSTTPENKLCDEIAGKIRKLFVGYKV